MIAYDYAWLILSFTMRWWCSYAAAVYNCSSHSRVSCAYTYEHAFFFITPSLAHWKLHVVMHVDLKYAG